MNRLCKIELCVEIGIKGAILVFVIVKGHIVGRCGKGLEKNVDPAGAMQIVVFEKVDDGVGMKRKFFYIFQKAEKRTGFSPLFEFNRFPFEKMVSFAGGIEKKGEVDPAICCGEEVLVAKFAAKSWKTAFMSANG
jgi:hypothetical protein